MTSGNPTCEAGTFFKSAVAAALFLFLAAGCTPRSEPDEGVLFTGAIMGTTYHVKVASPVDEAASTVAAQKIEAALQAVDEKMSTYKENSELSQLNRHPGGTPFPLSEETFAVLALARQVNTESGGAFDVTVGPLVNAWGFGPAERDTGPDAATIERLRALTGPDQFSLDPDAKTATKASDAVYIDLSAIAKGYAVDQVAGALDALGITDYMVEVGGEVRTAGHNTSGLPWRIAIEKPVDYERAIQEIVGLSGVSLATSGDYRNFYEVDGKRVSHTINPRTGQPVDHRLASVSVIHPECALADAYATALMVLGPEDGMAFAEAQGLAVFFVVHGEGEALETRQTASFAPYRLP